MTVVKATVNGAISIVNAIATGKGATLGTSLKVEAVIENTPGTGIVLETVNRNVSSRLVDRVVQKIVPKKELVKNKLKISLSSEVPTGYGLKSSSAISSVVALGCAKLFWSKLIDSKILLAGVDASIETKVSITGAYDDACACYYGGFVVTDNYKRKIVHFQKAPQNLSAVIFIPKSRKRGNIKNLKTLSYLFDQAWNLAKKSQYWEAMVLNGLATSMILKSDPKIILDLINSGAIGASVSGNGPAIAAVGKNKDISNIKKVFSSLEGRTVVSKINNKRAEVHEV